jgi:hypothetical protein
MPGLPFIAGKMVSAADLAAMKQGLAAANADDHLAGVRQALGIAGVCFTSSSDYARLTTALRQAEKAGVGLLL